VTVPSLRVEIAFAADPLAATSAYMVLTGASNSYASTPDAAALDVTGDLEMVARVSFDDWTPASTQTIVSKWNTSGDQRSYRLSVTTGGLLRLSYSTAGTAAVDIVSTVAAPFTNGVAYWVKATLDANNGASGHDVKFWWAADAEVEPQAWTQLGSTVTTAGTVSVFASTALLLVGAESGGASGLLAGDVYRAIVRNGIDGTTVADFDALDALSASSTTVGSSQVSGQTWTLGSAASLSIAPAWTDVSSYVRDTGVRISRGKGSEIPTYATSSLSLTLNNRDRRFDPEYTAGPYYPNVEPRKRIRVRAVYDGTVYTLWTGYVESWPQAYPNTNFDSVVELQAYDALSLLNDVVLEDAAYLYARDVIGDLVLAARTMANGVWRDEVSGAAFRRRRGVSAIGSPMAVGPATAVDFDGGTYYSFGPAGSTGLGQTSGDRTYSLWFTAETAPSLRGVMLRMDFRNTYLDVSLTADGNIYYLFDASKTVESDGTFLDGAPHHLVITHSGTTPKIYVDGQDVTGTGDTGAPSSIFGINMIGAYKSASANPTNYFTGTLSDLYVWSVALTADQVKTLYGLSSGSLQETSAARADRILDAAGIPAGLSAVTDIPRGVVAEIDVYDTSALSSIQAVADSESGSGRLFVDVNGRVTLHDRYWWQSSKRGSTVQATFSDDLADLYYVDVRADRNLRDVQNSITVTGSAGAASTQSDTTSVAHYGTRSASISTLLSTQGQVESLAYGLLQLRKDPVTRLDAITARPAAQPSKWPQVLRLELGDRVVHELMPARGVASTSQLVRTMLVERLDWAITVSAWQVQVTGSPVPTMSIFTLDESVLDGTDVLGF
jgi:hypothetical protein